MTEVVLTILIAYALWPLYVFAMALYRAHLTGRATLFAWLLAWPLIAAAVILDIALNYTLFALVTADFPKRGEWTFSQRLNRIIRGTGWRARVATWLADNLLDPYDPTGQHIRR